MECRVKWHNSWQCISSVNLIFIFKSARDRLIPCSRDDSGGNIFFAIQNGTVSIRKWGKQLRSWTKIQSFISATLTRVVVWRQRVRSGPGLRTNNAFTVSLVRGIVCECKRHIGICLFNTRAASPRRARFLRRVTPGFKELFQDKCYYRRSDVLLNLVETMQST